MTARTSLSLYLLETLVQAAAVLPAAAAVAIETSSLPPAMTLLGTRGPVTILDVALAGSDIVVAAGVVSAALLAAGIVLVQPLLMAGTVRSLAGEGRGPLRLVMLGAGRYPRYLLLNVVFLAVLAGTCLLISWTAGVGWVIAGCALAAILVAGLRDVAAAALGGPGSIRTGMARAASIARRRPALLVAGLALQAAGSWMLVIGALRLQLEFQSESLVPSILLGLGVQALVAARCIVRCAWLRLILGIEP